MAQFKAIKNKGFQVEFENGWTVSVQFGLYTYCDNYTNEEMEDVYQLTCPNAEVAVFKKGHRGLFAHPDFNARNVGTYWTPKRVLDLMTWAEAIPPEMTYKNLYQLLKTQKKEQDND